MDTVTLARTSITTSRLGYGTAGLMRCDNERDRLNILAAAFDAGITHYDTAPIYGLGQSERLLGRFASERRHAITVTTKFGLSLNPVGASLSSVQSALRRMISVSPVIAAAVRARSKAFYKPPIFSAAQARASLEQSLRRLRTDYIDLFLLHDCSVESGIADDLLNCLERLRQEGKVRAFGIATNFQHARAFQAFNPALCDVMQFESDALNANLSRLRFENTPFALITHSVLTSALPRLRTTFMSDRSLAQSWSKTLALDLTDSTTLVRLLLASAIASNPTGVVLVHSNSIEHLLNNAEAASKVPTESATARFQQLLAERFAPLGVETTIADPAAL